MMMYDVLTIMVVLGAPKLTCPTASILRLVCEGSHLFQPCSPLQDSGEDDCDDKPDSEAESDSSVDAEPKPNDSAEPTTNAPEPVPVAPSPAAPSPAPTATAAPAPTPAGEGREGVCILGLAYIGWTYERIAL